MIYINPYRFSNVNDNVFLALVNNLWSHAPNWSKGVVPTSTQNAIIRANCTVNTDFTVSKLIVESGYTLTGDTVGRLLTVNNGCEVYGSINLAASNHQLILNGAVNSIAGFTAGVLSNVTYGGVSKHILDLPYNHLSIVGDRGGDRLVYQTSDLTVNGNFFASGSHTFDSGNYSLTVKGTTNNQTPGNAGFDTWIKSGSSGSFVFYGLVTFNTARVNWGAGNPNVEFRGGINFNTYSFTSGTGVWTFSTNNQTVSTNILAGSLNCNWLIKSGIVLTITGLMDRMNAVINGENSTSTLNNNGHFILKNATLPMSTGIFNHANATNSTLEVSTGTTVSLPFTNYHNLITSGANTVVELIGNTTIANNLTINTYSKIQCSSYDLTVNGASRIDFGFLSKNGGGNILFVGYFTMYGAQLIDFSGNPSVEFRGGGTFETFLVAAHHVGTGVWLFSTNNQVINGFNEPFPFNNVLIANDVEVSVQSAPIAISGTLTGGNSNSKLINKGGIVNKMASEMMPIGILDVNSNANSVVYNRSGNQDVKAGTYRTLEFGGSGVKKLLGNVVVNTTAGGSWSITGSATIDYNGFTLTEI